MIISERLEVARADTRKSIERCASKKCDKVVGVSSLRGGGLGSPCLIIKIRDLPCGYLPSRLLSLDDNAIRIFMPNEKVGGSWAV